MTETTKSNIIYCPLQLSYARTIHTFQGYQAGPHCNIKHIICNAGSSKHEALFPGMFYTALSRATTIGTPEHTSSSAIHFVNLEHDRVENLRGTHEKTYSIIVKRDMWIQHLKRNKYKITDDSITNLEETSTVRFTSVQLDDRTSSMD